LTGKSCFEGKNQPEILKKIVMSSPSPICEVNPDIDEKLGKVVMRMLARNPEKRYKNMSGVIGDLNDFRVSGWIETRKRVRFLVPFFILLFLTACGAIYGGYTGLFEPLGFSLKGDNIESLPDAPISGHSKGLPLKEQLEHSRELIDNEQYPEAYHLLSHIIAIADDIELQAEAIDTRASLALQLMDMPNRALADCQMLIYNYPDSRYASNAHYLAGWIWFEKKNDLKKAINHLTTVLEHYPNSPEAQTASVVIQDAAVKLAKEGANVGLVIKSDIGAFFPNNWISVVLSLISFIPLISIPIASIMARHFKLEVDPGGNVSPFNLFKSVMKTPGLKTLIIIIVFSQMVSFILTRYQSRQDFINMENSIKQVGINVETK